MRARFPLRSWCQGLTSWLEIAAVEGPSFDRSSCVAEPPNAKTMIHSLKRNIAISVLSLPLLVGSSFASTLFYDNFPGTSFDTDKWTRVSFADLGIGVSEGVLTMPVNGWHHFNGLKTNDTSFNFHQGSLTAIVDMVSYDEPAQWGTGTAMSTELWFSFGPAANRDNLRSSDHSEAGFAFAIRWRSDSRLDVYSTSGLFSSTDLEAIPGMVTIDINPTNFTITLEGSGAAGSDVILSDEHGITAGAFTDYSFIMLQELRGFTGVVESSFNSVTIIPEPSTYAAILGLLAMAGFLVHRRRMR